MDQSTERLTLVAFGDAYNLRPWGPYGGITGLAALIDRERHASDQSLLMACGDVLSAEPDLSHWTPAESCKHMPVLLNALGVDYAVPGNHEYERGADVFRLRMRECRFDWVCTNVLEGDAPFGCGISEAVFTTAEGHRVGIMGLCTPDTPKLSASGPDVTFAPVIERARQAVVTFKQKGVHAIVAITHLSIAEDRQLVSAVPEIDVVLGGHDHHAMCEWAGHVPIIKAGSNFSHLARVDLDLNTKKRPRVVQTSLLVNGAGGSTAPAIDDALAQFDREARLRRGDQQQDQQHVATFAERIESMTNADCSMGRLVADLLCQAYQVDLFLIHAAALRGNRVYEPDHVVTEDDLRREMPFQARVVVSQLTGRDIYEALDHSLVAPHGKHHLHMSQGWHCVFDPAAPEGARVVAITRNGIRLADEDTLQVGMIRYLSLGGDGFASLARGQTIAHPLDETLLRDTMAACMRKRGTLYPSHEPRHTART
ncbi:Bifunctional metallophosphatase/5'-nucleotidase [Pandoravirus macleodensis]|uniref:Bifunctional metallophosphatase/5'-nucleotidase n=1 Tax=Pandoravirus macleodensis TaxID=2107707 RepID=A0A2U7UHE4_9VIRU|nr:Bifunctional metallophosphatase/5'-nucleotidase [Pandoravirus macleodensis]AVK77391.1 Bifunctional metallophosphatase/5'-nucleotidase [Pandoravirus macleodensis]